MGFGAKAAAGLIGALAILSPLTAAAQLPAGANYVALGSSFAAGPGITTPAENPTTRCSRSQDNYPHQLARRLGLALTDVSCSGATTANLLAAWNELPAQIDAVDANTRLVTVTIGGNDVLYSRGLSAKGCATYTARGNATPSPCGAEPPPPTEADYAALETHMRQIADEVRAPSARLVFVDYPAVLPPSGVCPRLFLTEAQADASREINRRVVEITARAARASGADVIAASTLSADHHACSAQPWTNGYPAPTPRDGVDFHPNLAAHTGIAEALAKLLHN